MLSAGKASSSSKEVKSGLEKSSHLKSYSFSQLLGESQHTVLTSRDLKSWPFPEQSFSILSFLAFGLVKGWHQLAQHFHKQAARPLSSLPLESL